MSILYLDCSMGAAGDMLTAALLELLPDKEAFLEELNTIGLPHTHISAEPSAKCGIQGSHVSVRVHGEEEGDGIHHHGHHHEHHHDHEHHGHEHHHSHGAMDEILHRISHLCIPQTVREDVAAVYGLLAQAESRVHGVPIEEIHFHEVGTLDALADITAVCLLIRKLRPSAILASPIHVGKGTVQCAHGILPVPAPATAELLKGIPIYSGEIWGELCTPTGAALLKYFVRDFTPMPPMIPTAIGYGMGKKDFPVANCIRAIFGEEPHKEEDVLELSCNLDDISAEDVAFATEELLRGGALDVYTTPIGMKKSRPGVKLSVLCDPKLRTTMLSILFNRTTTLGIREQTFRRHTLEREIVTVNTEFGPLRCKISNGYGTRKRKYEADDLARISQQTGLSLADIRRRLP